MAAFPGSADEVTARWLETHLRACGDARITAFRHEAIGTGQVGDTARFWLEWDRADQGPATVAAKFASSDATSRSTAALFGLYAKEVHFYAEVAPHLSVRTPRVYAREISADATRFVLLFEDMGPARGGNQIAGCTLGDARAAVIEAARLHAETWNAALLDSAAWLQPIPGVAERMTDLYPQAHAVFRERYAGQIDDAAIVVCDGLNARIGAWFGRRPVERALCHGDFRLDNMLFDCRGGRDPIAVVDWQTCAADCPIKDLAYFLGCGIGSALRRPNQTALLDLYCAEMTARGVPLTRDMIWNRYRLGALHGVATAVFSAAFVVRTPRGDANFLSMARNSCELAHEIDSLGALDALQRDGQC